MLNWVTRNLQHSIVVGLLASIYWAIKGLRFIEIIPYVFYGRFSTTRTVALEKNASVLRGYTIYAFFCISGHQ